MDNKDFFKILDSELEIALGCTEPGAVAYAASLAREQIPDSPIQKVEVVASTNIIKNAAAASIPGTCAHGTELAAALGAAIGCSHRKLRVLAEITPQKLEEAQELLKQRQVQVELAETPYTVYIGVTVWADNGDKATAVIAGKHTHIAKLEANGKILVDDFPSGDGDVVHELESRLSIDDIWKFVQNTDIENLEIIKRVIEVNTRLGQEGLLNPYGLEVGRSILKGIEKGFYTDNICSYAVALTASASDARMGGCSLPAYANSGSGNQGIQSTLPIVAVAQKIGSDQELLIRAVALSSLITIYIKTFFGRLSALCGATVAAIGASCGIVYLCGGNLDQVKCSIQNMLGNVTGIICDGAKSGCALKIATCTSAAVQSALLAMDKHVIDSSNGIIERDVKNTVKNLRQISQTISQAADKEILNIILEKRKGIGSKCNLD